MNRMSFVGGLAITLLFLSGAWADDPKPESKTIPLNQIWTNGMPGTRDIRELEAKLDVHDPSFSKLHEQSLVRQIGLSLASRRPKEGENVGPAFVVSGTGRKALQSANDVLRNNVEPTKTFSPEIDLTLVFYSVIGGPYVHIASVDKSEHVITVKYRFVLHSTRDDSIHFALIPLGKLRDGKYEIKIERLELTEMKSWVQAAIPKFERAVCRDTSITIRREKQ